MFHVKHPPARAARAALFSLGVLCALCELLVIREVLFLAGGTELALGAVLAAWLLAGAAGSLAGGRLKGARALGLLLGTCAFLLPAQIFCLRLVRGALAGQAGAVAGASTLLWLSCLLGAPLPAALGAVFPVSARMLGVRGAAKAYIVEAASLALGGALTLALVQLRQEHLAVALVCALFALGAGALSGRRAAALIAFAALALVLSGAWGALERASVGFAFRQGRIISTISTPHGRAFAAGRGAEIHIYSGGLSETPLAAANEAVELTLALVNKPGSVLVLCSDPEGYARTLGTFRGTGGTILVPDPDLLSFRRAFRPFETPGNVTLLAREPVSHLRGSSERLDAVILSVGAPLTAQNNRFYTLGFFTLLRGHLAPGGVVALELPYAGGHVSADLGALVGSIWETLGQVFGARRVALTQHAGSIILIAGDEPELRTRAPAACPDRRQAREGLGLYAPVDFDAALSSARVVLTTDMLDEGGWPVNTILAPVCYRRAIAHSQRRFGPPRVLAWLWRLGWWEWLGALGAISVVLSLRAHPDAAPCSAAAGGGFCAMVAQVAIIYIFQSAWGLLYSLVGLLMGAFMLGALTGALWSRGRRSAFLALGLISGLSLYLGALPWLLSGAALANAFLSRYILFPALSFAAGLLTGALFPACANLASARGAGRLYAADLAGASAGALLCGLVFMPALGLHLTALLACCGGLLLALPLLVSIIRFKAGAISPQRRRDSQRLTIGKTKNGEE